MHIETLKGSDSTYHQAMQMIHHHPQVVQGGLDESEAFALFLRALEQSRPEDVEITHPSGYIAAKVEYAVGVVAKRTWAKQKGNPTVSLDEIVESVLVEEEREERLDPRLESCLHRAMKAMTEGQRDAVQRCTLDGYPQRDYAKEHGISPACVSARIQRGLRAAYKYLMGDKEWVRVTGNRFAGREYHPDNRGRDYATQK